MRFHLEYIMINDCLTWGSNRPKLLSIFIDNCEEISSKRHSPNQMSPYIFHKFNFNHQILLNLNDDFKLRHFVSISVHNSLNYFIYIQNISSDKLNFMFISINFFFLSFFLSFNLFITFSVFHWYVIESSYVQFFLFLLSFFGPFLFFVVVVTLS